MSEQERKDFEADYRKRYGHALFCESEWRGWQAGRAALRQQAVPADARDGINGPFNACMYREHCRSMLAAAPAAPKASQGAEVAAIVREDCGRKWADLKQDLLPGAPLYAEPQATPVNTPTHEHLSTMIGMVLGARQRGKMEYADGSVMDKSVKAAIEHLKDWPYPEQAAPQAEQRAGEREYQRAMGDWLGAVSELIEAMGRPAFKADTPVAVIAEAIREAAKALAAQQAEREPLFLLHCGQIDSGGEQDDWDVQADSYRRVEEFCLKHPGKTIKLYPHVGTQPEREPLTNAQIAEASRAAHIDFALCKHQTYEHALTRSIERAHGIGKEVS